MVAIVEGTYAPSNQVDDHPVAIGLHLVGLGSAGLRKGRPADRVRLALAEAGGFQVGFAQVDGDGLWIILLSEVAAGGIDLWTGWSTGVEGSEATGAPGDTARNTTNLRSKGFWA